MKYSRQCFAVQAWFQKIDNVLFHELWKRYYMSKIQQCHIDFIFDLCFINPRLSFKRWLLFFEATSIFICFFRIILSCPFPEKGQTIYIPPFCMITKFHYAFAKVSALKTGHNRRCYSSWCHNLLKFFNKAALYVKVSVSRPFPCPFNLESPWYIFHHSKNKK